MAIIDEVGLRLAVHDEFTKAMAEFVARSKEIQDAAKKTKDSFSAMSTSMALAGGAIAGALTLMVKSAMQSDDAVAKVARTISTTGDEFLKNKEKLSAFANTMSEEIPFSSEEVMNAMQTLIVKGHMPLDEAMKKTSGLLRFMADTNMEGRRALTYINAEMAKGRDVLAEYADKAKLPLTPLEQMKVATNTLRNAMEDLGSELIPILIKVTDKVKEMKKAYDEVPKPVKEVGMEIASWTALVLLSASAVLKFSSFIKGLITGIGGLNVVLFGTKVALGEVAAILTLVAIAAKTTADIFEKQNKEMLKQKEYLQVAKAKLAFFEAEGITFKEWMEQQDKARKKNIISIQAENQMYEQQIKEVDNLKEASGEKDRTILEGTVNRIKQQIELNSNDYRNNLQLMGNISKAYDDYYKKLVNAEKEAEDKKITILKNSLLTRKGLTDDELKFNKDITKKIIEERSNDELKIYKIKQEYERKKQSLELETYELSHREFLKMRDAMESSFSAAIFNLAKGMTNFSDFMTNMMDAILDAWINMLADMVARWMAAQAAMGISSIMSAIGSIFLASATGGISGGFEAGATVFAAKGFEGIVNSPTPFIAGESGAERVSVQPLNTTRTNTNSAVFNVNVNQMNNSMDTRRLVSDMSYLWERKFKVAVV